MKESFILYTEQKAVVDKLTDEQAGKLFKTLYEYVSTDNVPEMDTLLELVFIPFKTMLDRNAEKYERVSKARANAGAKGGKQKQANCSKTSNCKQNVAKQANDSNCNDNENDNDNVNDNDNESGSDYLIIPTPEQIQQFILDNKLDVSADAFYSYYNSNKWKDVDGKNVIWKQKLFTWNNYEQKRSANKFPNRYHGNDIENIEKYYTNLEVV